MPTDNQPHTVLDAQDPSTLTSAGLRATLPWLRDQGIDPDLTRRVEVYAGDPPTAVVHQFTPDEQGHVHCGLDHDHNTGRCEPTIRESRVTLTTLPPIPQEANASA